jgi:hypothetical protein
MQATLNLSACAFELWSVRSEANKHARIAACMAFADLGSACRGGYSGFIATQYLKHKTRRIISINPLI